MSTAARKRVNRAMRDRRRTANGSPFPTSHERNLIDAYHDGDAGRFRGLLDSRPGEGVGMALVLAAGIFDEEDGQ